MGNENSNETISDSRKKMCWDNKEDVLEAVKIDGHLLFAASDDIQNDIYGDRIPIHELPL